MGNIQAIPTPVLWVSGGRPPREIIDQTLRVGGSLLSFVMPVPFNSPGITDSASTAGTMVSFSIFAPTTRNMAEATSTTGTLFSMTVPAAFTQNSSEAAAVSGSLTQFIVPSAFPRTLAGETATTAGTLFSFVI